MEIFGPYIDFAADTRDGDIFKVIVAAEWLGERFISYDAPQAIYYKGARTGEITAIRFPPDAENAKYYKPDGMALKEIISDVPLKTIRVTSPFNLGRLHPILKVRKPHNGVDLAAPIGTPVYAFADGVVRVAGERGAMGNMVQIDHSGQVSTYYGHLHRFASGIKGGVRVRRGQVIGYVGSTGRSTGPHLHFGYRKKNAWFDPMKFLSIKTTNEKMIVTSLKEGFFRRVKTMLAFLDAIDTGEKGPLAPGQRQDEVTAPLPAEKEKEETPEAGEEKTEATKGDKEGEKTEKRTNWNSEWQDD